MTREWNPPKGPTPEQLAACTDGELHGSEREQVEAWLVQHPDRAAEIEGARQVQRLWESTAAPLPTPLAWEAAFGRITDKLRSGRKPSAPLPWWVRAGLGAIAAAVLLGLLTRPLWEVDRSPLPVASGQDVTILSMDAGDAGLLVVGQPPIQGNIDLADHGDVELVSRVDPDIHLEDWITPMIVDPQALVRDTGR